MIVWQIREYQELAMKIALAFILTVTALSAIACSGGQDSPMPQPTPASSPSPVPTATPTLAPTTTPTPVPTVTPDVPATVQAGIEATKGAETALTATVEASIAATQAAVPPTPTPPPTPISYEEKLVGEFFDCLESNLTLAGSFTSSYDGPLSEQVHTILDAVGDVTIHLHDFGAFQDAMLLAMDANSLVVPAVFAVNVGCSLIGSDDQSEKPPPTGTPTPEPTAASTSEPTPPPEE